MRLQRKAFALLWSAIVGYLLLGCSTINNAMLDSAFDTEKKDEERRQEAIKAKEDSRLFWPGAK